MVSRTSLDRELLLSELGTDSVTLEVVVTDNGIPKLSDTATITVTLLDENDSKPTFSKVFFFSFKNNIFGETAILSTILFTCFIFSGHICGESVRVGGAGHGGEGSVRL